MPKAGATGLEPATSGVTGRRSNQLSYAPQGDRKYVTGPTWARLRRATAVAPASVCHQAVASWLRSQYAPRHARHRARTGAEQPGPAHRRRPARRAALTGRLPTGRARLQPATHVPLRPRPAPDPARRLPALRPDLQHARLPRARRLHARPGGQPLRHRLPRRQLRVARRQLRRPDPAARGRAADDRRRVSSPRPADHAAGLPPRADRCGHRDDRAGDAARARRVAARPGRRPLPLGARARAARRDARPSSASTPTRRTAVAAPPSTSSSP
ncbi:MAG: hypothetical protein JWQ48_2059 [Conexibacter sp.]|nr:hypothetical protein [Conexibacter sp.]